MKNTSNRVFVTGMGIISAMGIGVQQNLERLVEGRSGIGQINFLQTRHKGKLQCGEIPFSNEELISRSGIKDTKGISRAALIGLIAAEEAINGINFKDDEIRTGIISGTTADSMSNIELYLKDFLSNDEKNEFIESQDWGFSTEIIAREIGIKGYQSTINTACSSAANAIMTGARMIRNDKLDRILVGGTDAISRTTLNGFHALMVIDPDISKPFDRDRMGMNLGEGAAFLVIESEKIAVKNKVLCEITGFGNANDAFHLTALTPEGKGAASAMQQALAISELNPEEIDYLNAHGTGSDNNDLSEARGIEKVFGINIPKFSSTKPFTGHTLGSSGALEAVFSILSLQHNLIFPNLNFKHKMVEVNTIPETRLIRSITIHHVLSNSLGFGGNITSLVFSKIQS